MAERKMPSIEARLEERISARRWLYRGIEPSTDELLTDPIAILLMRADKLTVREVEAVIRAAGKRPAREFAPTA